MYLFIFYLRLTGAGKTLSAAAGFHLVCSDFVYAVAFHALAVIIGFFMFVATRITQDFPVSEALIFKFIPSHDCFAKLLYMTKINTAAMTAATAITV